MSNQHSDEGTILINAYVEWDQLIAQAESEFGPIICGKPGKGYKARRKLDRVIRDCRTLQTVDLQRLRVWARGTSKMSLERRQRRLERIRAVIPTFTLD